jgi:hypothetical protein
MSPLDKPRHRDSFMCVCGHLLDEHWKGRESCRKCQCKEFHPWTSDPDRTGPPDQKP